MKNKFYLIFLCLVFPFLTNAQKAPKTNKKAVGKGYDQIYPFIKGKAKVVRNGKIGFININGEEFIQCIYDEVFPFENGKAKVMKNNLYGFINDEGEEIIECKFDYIGPFKNGRAIVKLQGKLELIDTEGAVITEGNHPSTP